MAMKDYWNRRTIIKTFMIGTGAALLRGKAQAADGQLKGRIKQSVTRGSWKKYSWDEFAKAVSDMGMVGIDLVGEDGWPYLKKHGLAATMCPGAGSIIHGANRIENHKQMQEDFKKNINAAAKEGWKNVITFSGSRHGLEDEEGQENCHLVLKQAAKLAEDKGVTICMELLNSKIDHPGYMCDRTEWGADLVRRVGSPNFKLLYDIYHMQIMEGDVIRTIKRNIDFIGHFHTAGNPGRNDLDEDQELNYRGIMKSIVKLQDEGKYSGYVAHEFGPKKDLESLREAIAICDV